VAVAKKAAQRARVDTHLTNRHFFDGIVGRDMKFVQLEQQQGVALLRLNRGVINALNLQVLRELSELLRGVKDDLKVRGLVLASANDKFFSIGFDLPELYNLSAEEFRLFFKTYNLLCLDLYTFPQTHGQRPYRACYSGGMHLGPLHRLSPCG